MTDSFTLPTIKAIEDILFPLKKSIDEIKATIDKQPKIQYYRNKDLKELFGLSDNTICSYRVNNKIPYTYIGDIYYYPVDEINKILKTNSNYDMVQI